MKHLSLIILLPLIIVYCSGQNVESSKIQKRNGLYYFINEYKPFSGSVYDRYDNGQFSEKFEVKNGEMVGIWKTWYKNGQIKKKATIKDSKYVDEYIEWYKNGAKKIYGTYKEGIKDNNWIEWYKNGAKKIYGTYKEGIKDNNWIEWYDNGQIHKNESYSMGKATDTSVVWTKEGALIEKVIHINDSTTSVTRWYKNGNIHYKGCSFKDSKIGQCVIYYEDGKKCLEMFFKKSEDKNYIPTNPSGKWIYYTDKGDLVEIDDIGDQIEIQVLLWLSGGDNVSTIKEFISNRR